MLFPKRIFNLRLALLLSFAVACQTPTPTLTIDASPETIRKVAKEAYIYGYPVVDNYRFLYGRSMDTTDEMYLAPVGVLGHEADVMKAGQKAVQTVNTETPYSRAVLDFRTEPMVLSIPTIPEGRYYSMQLIDMYTHNYAYVGTRTEGNAAANYLLTGPNWTGTLPAGIKKAIRCETDLMTLIGRTQLFGPDDLPNVKQIQSGYKLQPLSAYLSQSAPKAIDNTPFIKPLRSAAEMKQSLAFFQQLNFALRFCPVVESEKNLMASFATIGIGAGLPFDTTALTLEQKQAFYEGIQDAWTAFAALQKDAQQGKISSKDIFGTREELNNNYLYRWAGDILGIYGNTYTEAIYPGYETDADGEPLDAAKHNYTIRLLPNQMPPANAFWSITMYDLPNRLLVANVLDRYVINSPMLPKLKKDPDGGITIYLQSKTPGKSKESNWLPTPNGPFFAVMRLYWPKPEALNGTWKQPPLQKQR